MAGRGGKQVNTGLFARGSEERKDRDNIWREKYYSRGWYNHKERKEDSFKDYERKQMEPDIKILDLHGLIQVRDILKKYLEESGWEAKSGVKLIDWYRQNSETEWGGNALLEIQEEIRKNIERNRD